MNKSQIKFLQKEREQKFWMKQKVKKEEMTGFHAPPPAKKAETASRGVTEMIQLQFEIHF